MIHLHDIFNKMYICNNFSFIKKSSKNLKIKLIFKILDSLIDSYLFDYNQILFYKIILIK